MGKKAKFAVTFILVLAGTMILVAVLSAMPQDSPQAAADRYIQELHSAQQAKELSAPATGQQGISLFASLTGFMCIIATPLVGWLMIAKARRNSQRARERRINRRLQRAVTAAQGPSSFGPVSPKSRV